MLNHDFDFDGVLDSVLFHLQLPPDCSLAAVFVVGFSLTGSILIHLAAFICRSNNIQAVC